MALTQKSGAPRFGERGSGAGGRNNFTLARSGYGGSLNRLHACAIRGGGSFAAPLGHALSTETTTNQQRRKKSK